MPIVFVHGVNNRDGPDYRQKRAVRTAFLRRLVAPVVGLEADNVTFIDPYWGHCGVKFRWGQVSLPTGAEKYEEFGGDQHDEDLELLAALPEIAGINTKSLVSAAQKSLSEVVDLVWATAALSTSNARRLDDLVKAYPIAHDYAAREPTPRWLASATLGNFSDQLIAEMSGSDLAAGYEAFGIEDVIEDISEGASRLNHILGNLSGSVATAVGRERAHVAASTFLGDIFQYLTNRGRQEKPGEIPDIVLKALRDGSASRNARDPKLIVIGHSLGGVITYDLLTHFAPEINVDAFVSIGSQVALFEEMTLYVGSNANIPADPSKERLPKPPNIASWLNVFDESDIFSFRTEGVFDGVRDYSYDTGFGMLGAHSGYFERPSFYKRLAERLGSLNL